MKLDELPIDLLLIICDFALFCNDPDARLESNITTLCSLDLISSSYSKNHGFSNKLEEIWRVILLSYLAIVMNDDQRTINVMKSGCSFQVENFEQTLGKAKSKTYKRCFGLLRECEKRIQKKRFQPEDIDTPNENRAIPISVTGISGSGVKSMLYRYFENGYIGDRIETVQMNDAYSKEINIGDRMVKFEYRNGSTYEDRLVRDGVFRYSAGHLIVCSADTKTVHETSLISSLISMVGRVHDDELMPIILCFNKVDLLKDNPKQYILKESNLLEMTDKQFYTNVEIIPTSSKENLNISTVMEKIAKKAYFYIDGSVCLRMRRQLQQIVKNDKKVLKQFDKKSNCILS